MCEGRRTAAFQRWAAAYGSLRSQGRRCGEDTPSHSRGAFRPSFAVNVPPSKQRAQGMPGARCTRGLVRKRKVGCTHEHTGSAEASGIPCVMALRLMPCSPRRRIRLVTAVGDLSGFSIPVGLELPPPTWRQQRASGPHGLPYAKTSFVLRAVNRSRGSSRPATAFARRRCRVHHIPSRVRDDARPPLLPERDGRN